MARTNKTGIDYYPFDTGFFEDDKIQLIESEFGMKGGYIAIRLLCKIYKEGYFYPWDTDRCLLFTKAIGSSGVSKHTVDNVVNTLVKRDFFDKECFNKFRILTSRGIQRRYFEIIRRYKSVNVISEYLLVDISALKNVHIYSINDSINSENADINKQIKRKEKKRNNIPPLIPPLPGENAGEEKTWRNDFNRYLSELTEAYQSLLNDEKFIAGRQRYYPHVDIRLTLEKSYRDYWCTEEAWEKRKRSKTRKPDWRATLRNSINQKFNQVYLNKSGNNEQTAVHIIS
ncbi:MAG: DUF4373 domain-containing protein [Tannerellaceae bacterium]|nr:DUF4373 domain-containing protein [Tannerellaceae bacterium]